MTGAVTLAAAAVASVGVGAYSAYESSKVAGHAMSQGDTVFSEQQDYARQLADLIQNPSSVTKLPGYQFNFEQGTDAVHREMAASGFAGSGNEATALTQYGQGYAMNTFNQYAALLAGLSGLGSPVNPTQSLSVASGANNTSFNQTGSLLASLGYLGRQYGSTGQNPWAGTIPSDYSWATQSNMGPGTVPAAGGYQMTWGEG